MSSVAEEADADICCANCGIVELDDIKLEECDGCDLVKYCCDNCKQAGREKHDEECKKRAQEIRDKELFRQPDGNHHGECPLCFLPMPLDPQKSIFYSCCSSVICYGCDYANDMSNGGDRC